MFCVWKVLSRHGRFVKFSEISNNEIVKVKSDKRRGNFFFKRAAIYTINISIIHFISTKSLKAFKWLLGIVLCFCGTMRLRGKSRVNLKSAAEVFIPRKIGGRHSGCSWQSSASVTVPTNRRRRIPFHTSSSSDTSMRLFTSGFWRPSRNETIFWGRERWEIPQRVSA